MSISELLLHYGVENIIVCDTRGAIYKQRTINMNDQKCEMAHMTNHKDDRGKLANVIKDADVFIGVSVENSLKVEHINLMSDKPIVFALATPNPEISVEDGKQYAHIFASGMTESVNCVNTLLATPGIMRALINKKCLDVTIEMKTEAAHAIANALKPEYLDVNCILPDFMDYEVHQKVSNAIAKVATEQGMTTKNAKLPQNAISSYMTSISIPAAE